MYELRIVTYPASVLRNACDLVDDVDEKVIALAQNMAKLMIAAQGIGLAAPQVGVPRQIITANVGDGFIYLINPRIQRREGRNRMEEGCLSCPGISVDVDRSERILVHGLDLAGREISLEAEGLKARVLQHEIDHLKGVLILDKLPWPKRVMAQRKLRGS